MNNPTSMPCYRVHLTRLDGTIAIHNHCYYDRQGNAHEPAKVVARFNKDMGWKGYKVDRIEIFHFDPTA